MSRRTTSSSSPQINSDEHVSNQERKHYEKENDSGFSYWVSMSPLLAILVLQSSGVSLLARRAARSPLIDYDKTIAVILCELIKVLVSLMLLFKDCGFSLLRLQLSLSNIRLRELSAVAVPGILYAFQNNLAYVALENVSAAVYQILLQSKIVFTALFGMFLLGRWLKRGEWGAVLVHLVGVVLVEWSMNSCMKGDEDNSKSDSSYGSMWLGSGATLLCGMISGFAGVVNEAIIKGVGSSSDAKVIVPKSIWRNNFYLNLISFSVAITIACFQLSRNLDKYLVDTIRVISSKVYGHAIDPEILTMILVQSVGGILVPVVVARTGSMVKCFAYSLSIVLTCAVAQWLFGDYHRNIPFYLGAFLVVVSLIMIVKFK